MPTSPWASETPPLLEPRIPSRPCQAQLRKLRNKFTAVDLLHVLESLPPATDISMKNATIKGCDAIRLSLGSRPQADGTLVPVYGFVTSKHNETSSHVFFRYTMQSPATGHEHLLPRSASSMVRKAGGFLPPFRFLQYDPALDDTQGGGDMLRALILYYALSAGHSDEALRWPSFEDNLYQTLQHIGASYEYQVWMRKQSEGPHPSLTVAVFNGADKSIMPKNSFANSKTNPREPDLSRLIASKAQPIVKSTPQSLNDRSSVVSKGSSVIVKAGTVLADFVKALGKNNLGLLDSIPQETVFIEKQTVLANRMPYRLLLGSFSPANGHQQASADVFVYCSGKFTFIQTEDQDGTVLTYTYATLQDVKLYQPFASIRRMEKSTHANKTRALVKYFLMLAENEGLIEAPPVDINIGFMAHFRLLCADFRNQRLSSLTSLNTTRRDNGSEVEHDAEHESVNEPISGASLGQGSGTKSLLVKLKLDKALPAEDEIVQSDASIPHRAVSEDNGQLASEEAGFVQDTDSDVPGNEDVMPSIETVSSNDTADIHRTPLQPPPSPTMRIDTAVASAEETDSPSWSAATPYRDSTSLSGSKRKRSSASLASSLQSVTLEDAALKISEDVAESNDRIVIDLRSDVDDAIDTEVKQNICTRATDRLQGYMGKVDGNAAAPGSHIIGKRRAISVVDLDSDDGMVEVFEADWKRASQRCSTGKKMRHSA
ncbi:hypothetical protein NX059_001929 [Plenodomus lindquistii]|nr:hypothetical protein NX059_001929 [Plenodomus lindquistii]